MGDLAGGETLQIISEVYKKANGERISHVRINYLIHSTLCMIINKWNTPEKNEAVYYYYFCHQPKWLIDINISDIMRPIRLEIHTRNEDHTHEVHITHKRTCTWKQGRWGRIRLQNTGKRVWRNLDKSHVANTRKI